MSRLWHGAFMHIISQFFLAFCHITWIVFEVLRFARGGGGLQNEFHDGERRRRKKELQRGQVSQAALFQRGSVMLTTPRLTILGRQLRRSWRSARMRATAAMAAVAVAAAMAAAAAAAAAVPRAAVPKEKAHRQEMCS